MRFHGKEHFNNRRLKMDEARKCQILTALLKNTLCQTGVKVISSAEFKRKLGNFSKELKIPAAELTEVIEPIIRDLVEEMFGKTKTA